MLLVEDLLVKPFLSILDVLQTLALRELYDVAALKDDLKENQLLYEVGERSESEYRRRKQELEEQLRVAEAVHEQISGRVEVKGT